MLCVVGKDGNDQLFPIALDRVDSECKRSWKWFIDLLSANYERLGKIGWVFLSDQQKEFLHAYWFMLSIPNMVNMVNGF